MRSSSGTVAIRHLGLPLILMAALIVGTVGGVRRSAAVETADETAFMEAINDLRADLGLGELTHHEELADLARQHAAAMAAQGEIFHADPISAGLQAQWLKLGENVGVGASVEVLMDAFIASPGHYANLIDPSFTEIGVGVVWVGDILYTTHRFMQAPGRNEEAAEPPATTSTASPVAADRYADALARPVMSPERFDALFALLDAG